MEHKLYYKDPYITSFWTEVIDTGKDNSGRDFAVLKETAFYPTGGGQPFDTGIIDGVQVIEIEEVDGEIRHYLERPVEKKKVHGQVDWERRFDHMQQHSGQHILSAAFEDLFDMETVGFHLGKEFVTIDLDTPELEEKVAQEAEKVANKIVAENRPIIVKWVDAEEAREYPLRKELSVEENIRLVMIPDFDYGGCGGTHPKSTGETGPIKILGWERQRKKIRLEFVCGQRVLKQLQAKQTIIRELSGILNAPEGKLPEAAEKLVQNGKSLDKEVGEAREALIRMEAEKLVTDEPANFYCKAFEGRSLQELQKLAKFAISFNQKAVFLLVSNDGERLQVVCGRGENAEGNMKDTLTNALSLIEGKGGGNEAFAQGSGKMLISPEELLRCLKTSLEA
ncbi:alanyl-tRNA editing protein [Bacillus massilinigeriensis]|uniref:alanyl-tRNA editing protein n=1 Tax=Bacillus mediterraneensis TaxID=1805474 RepID=UPI0008F89786|nr:DHHA1 domain-containing protein [Bacillus mediterraneensis]